jgi:hypothetical protein
MLFEQRAQFEFRLWWDTLTQEEKRQWHFEEEQRRAEEAQRQFENAQARAEEFQRRRLEMKKINEIAWFGALKVTRHFGIWRSPKFLFFSALTLMALFAGATLTIKFLYLWNQSLRALPLDIAFLALVLALPFLMGYLLLYRVADLYHGISKKLRQKSRPTDFMTARDALPVYEDKYLQNRRTRWKANLFIGFIVFVLLPLLALGVRCPTKVFSC